MMVNNSYYSLTSIYLDLFYDEQKISSGTGYIIKHNHEYFLITNYHVISGRDFITQEPISISGAIPNQIGIRHHIKDEPGNYKQVFEKIPNQIIGGPNMNMDLVIIKLTNIFDKIQIYPIEYLDQREYSKQEKIYPGQSVCIIGFPYGVSQTSKLPIWKTGSIASEYNFPFQSRKNCFLVDASTRTGMSGSPVVAYFGSNYTTNGGTTVFSGGGQYKFLGTYSGRRNFKKDDMLNAGLSSMQVDSITSMGSDIGLVWKSECITELLNHYYSQ